jgi:hypothetical protein
MASKKDKQGYLLIAGMVLLVVAFFGFKMSQDNKPKPGVDNCLGAVTANTVVVLDHSEEVTEQTRREISARAMAYILDKVKPNERVSVFTVSDLSKNALTPLFSRCRPPDDGNRLVENTRLLHKRFVESFEKPVRQALTPAPMNSKESPIAQALTDISLSQYLRGETNTLVVFSDMLENTSKFTIYGCQSAATVVSRYRESRRGAQERPAFKNTNVSLNLIPRPDQSKEVLRCRDQLWSWFFGDNSGPNAGLNVDYLPGGSLAGAQAAGVKK